MLNMIRDATNKMKNMGGDPEVILLSPGNFKKLFKGIQEMSPGLPYSAQGKFMFENKWVIEYQYCPPGVIYLLNIDEAEKILGYRPSF